MNSDEIGSDLANYWRRQNVVCPLASFSGELLGTELAQVWGTIGMPSQNWWLFQFSVPSDSQGKRDVGFGIVGVNWKLYYRVAENICIVIDHDGVERFANSTFVAFAQTLVSFDKGYRRIQIECAGDSGEDWDHGDVIIEEMEASMRMVDAQAFQDGANLWPYLLSDVING
jgi:hypothetical protein